MIKLFKSVTYNKAMCIASGIGVILGLWEWGEHDYQPVYMVMTLVLAACLMYYANNVDMLEDKDEL